MIQHKLGWGDAGLRENMANSAYSQLKLPTGAELGNSVFHMENIASGTLSVIMDLSLLIICATISVS